MNEKKLVVDLVTALTLTLFTGAAYAQQLAAPRRTTQQHSPLSLTKKSATKRATITSERRYALLSIQENP
jgi:hypothetical protein